MKQLLLVGAPTGGLWTLDQKTAHYLVNVRRTRLGTVLVCRDPNGRVFEARLVNAEDKWCLLENSSGPVIDADQTPNQSSDKKKSQQVPFSLELVQALPKGKKLDDIVRQATELGVTGIHLLQSDYAIADFDARWQSKHDRLVAIAREACQQSNNPRLPFINRPLKSDDFARQFVGDKNNLGLLFYENNLAQSSLHRYLDGLPTRVMALIGPEGGFSTREVELFLSYGYYCVSLGSTILRTETAAIAALSTINALSRERTDWILRELN